MQRQMVGVSEFTVSV